MLLWRDRILAGGRADDLEILHLDLVLAFDFAVFFDRSHDLETGLLLEAVRGGEELGRDIALEDNGLHDSASVADLEKMQLSARALVVEPSLKGHLLADEIGEVADGHDAVARRGRNGRN